jgi:hypothetical protein
MSTLERVSPQLVLRKTDATVRVTAPGLPTASSTPMSSTTMPLVSRKPDAALAAAQSPASSVPTSSPGVLARDTNAQAAQHPRAWTTTGHLDIDWITEQVGSRLARRLEIDRERQGVRQWRQVS